MKPHLLFLDGRCLYLTDVVWKGLDHHLIGEWREWLRKRLLG